MPSRIKYKHAAAASTWSMIDGRGILPHVYGVRRRLQEKEVLAYTHYRAVAVALPKVCVPYSLQPPASDDG